MKMAAVGADWSKRLIKTREGEGEGREGEERGLAVRNREGGERNQHRPRAYNIIFIFRTKDVIS